MPKSKPEIIVTVQCDFENENALDALAHLLLDLTEPEEYCDAA